MTTYIMIEHVYKHFGKSEVLTDINMEMQGGKIYGLVGRNGSGKSVLMKCICGLMPVSSGKLMVNGTDVSDGKHVPESIGAVIESPGFLDFYSGYRNLKLLADLSGKIESQKIRQVIQTVGLDPDMKKRVGAYSMGMRQRLGLAQAIMEDPSILILDEPMNGLDDHGMQDIRNMILQQKAQGKLVIIASHINEDIDLLCDSTYSVSNGRICLMK